MSLKENKLIKYFSEAKTELMRVTWPSRKEIISSTLAVIGVTLGLAIFLGGLDFGLNKLLEILISTQATA